MGMLGLAGYFVHENGDGYWEEWLISLSISYACGWAFSLAFTVVVFSLMFNCCKENDHKFKFIVTYQDYVNWKGEYDETSGGNRGSVYEQVSQEDAGVDVVQPIDL